MTETTKIKNTVELPKSIFEVEVNNHELLKLAYNSYLANSRENLAKTLRRGEVSGGGKKPWKQKGTGRARFGSSRNPIWRKGGVVFGPLGVENYSKKMSVQAKRVAIKQALTLAYQDNRVIIIDDLTVTGKTKDFAKFLELQKVHPKDKVVIAVEAKTDVIVRSTRNVPNVIVSQAKYLNVFNILNADKLFITKSALVIVEEWLGGVK